MQACFAVHLGTCCVGFWLADGASEITLFHVPGAYNPMCALISGFALCYCSISLVWCRPMVLHR